MNISTDHRLAEIVDLVPGAPRVLESFDLDYCCGGQRPLGDACDLAGIDVAEVIEALAGLDDGPAPDWVPMSPALLVDHLEATHHAYLHAELPRIEALADKVVGVHGARHPELVEVARLCTSLREDLEPHMAKEERVLFPMVRELASAVSPPSFHCGSVANPISMMMREHEQTGSILEALRSQTDGYHAPDDACASYRALYEALDALEADTHLHIHKENNVLFPAVLELEKHWEAAR
ncbi:MAG TPA: iron-sulfur cluster repair di-iron protein [Microthrixaceae bacterium]|jgi:regulator of cell morphogenesis and NO signaling|nr:iron-sulfur cluster repair di-iron protein [Rhodoglobus sp.]HQF93469.1 iron-sulfur cluster repair di-iron protein [Microthrixaceae bacterium]